MAYQNGTATSPTDLLQKLATFLQSNGWTQDMSQADGSGWRLHMHKGTTYINIRAAINENNGSNALFDGALNSVCSGFSLYVGTGFSSGSNWKTQAGGPQASGYGTAGVGCPTGAGAITGYHFFADATADNITVVIEKSASIFGYFGWGAQLQKLGIWTGGAYFYGSMDGRHMSYYDQVGGGPGFANVSAFPPGSARTQPMAFVRVDVDSFTGKWVGIGNSTVTFEGYTGKKGASTIVWSADVDKLPATTRLYQRLTNQLNGQSLLLPIRWGVERDIGGYSFIGQLPTVFVSNACNKGFTPGTVYTWGTDDYIIFPGPSSNTDHGFAVRKV